MENNPFPFGRSLPQQANALCADKLPHMVEISKLPYDILSCVNFKTPRLAWLDTVSPEILRRKPNYHIWYGPKGGESHA